MEEPPGGSPPTRRRSQVPRPRSFQASRFDKGGGLTLDSKPWKELGEVSGGEQGDFWVWGLQRTLPLSW